MDVTSAFSLASLGWLAAQAIPLVLWPSFVGSLLVTDVHVAPVAIYFARALGLAQLTLALQGLLLTGLLPLRPAHDGSTTADAAPPSPYAWAAVFVSTLYHGAAAFYSYGCYYGQAQPSVTAYAVGCTGSSALAAFGVWCLLFGDGGHISKRTGADKRTSGFPFTNAAAEKRKAK